MEIIHLQVLKRELYRSDFLLLVMKQIQEVILKADTVIEYNSFSKTIYN